MRTLVLILLFSIPAFAQESKGSLYSKGLQSCLERELVAYSAISRRDFRQVIVESDPDITKNLPTQLGEISIQYLNNFELAEKYKALLKSERERGIPFIKIFPLYDKDDKLFFAYNNYWFSYSEKGGFFSSKAISFHHSLEGGCRAEIIFEPAEKKFVIGKVELWGV